MRDALMLQARTIRVAEQTDVRVVQWDDGRVWLEYRAGYATKGQGASVQLYFTREAADQIIAAMQAPVEVLAS